MADELLEEEAAPPVPAPELSDEARARREIALRQIRQFGDPILRAKARPIDVFDDALREEVARMGRLMIDSIGIGLAATQVGTLNRVLVYRVQQESPVNALINPVIEWRSKDADIMEEGCLSLPGIIVDVERPVHIRVTAWDELGENIEIQASGLVARVIQHEVDPLDGVFILDRTRRAQRKEAVRALRERED